MKTAIIFSEGIKQINFTPENDDEKQALKLITPSDDISLAVKIAEFGSSHIRPLGIKINETRGGYLRVFEESESIMLVLSPKSKDTPECNGEYLKCAVRSPFFLAISPPEVTKNPDKYEVVVSDLTKREAEDIYTFLERSLVKID